MNLKCKIFLVFFCLFVLKNQRVCSKDQYKAYQEKPIVVVITSYNNNQLFEGAKRYKLNLDSVFSQKYENYRILYIDDNSTDRTARMVERYVIIKKQQHRCTIIKNTERFGPSRNRYIGIHMCNDDEIVLLLDGDDFLAHEYVFEKINQVYQDEDIWLTYSRFQTVPDGKLSGGKEVPRWVVNQNAYRAYGWYYHSLKTFYAWLFKLIKKEDLLYQGNFYPISSDLAEMLPMMEMSGGRFQFISEVMYYAVQHSHNEVNTNGRPLMAQMSNHILNSKPYEPLETRPKIQNND